MYADDAFIFTHSKSPQEGSQLLTASMTHVDKWVKKSHLKLNTKKNVCMMFNKKDS